MSDHPVGFLVERSARPQRVHVLIRLVLLLALGALCRSPLWGILYLAVPALVALRIGQRSGDAYLRDDAPRLARPLGWLAAAFAYLWLLTDEPPTARPSTVHFEVEPAGTPTVGSALLRLLTSLPAVILLAVLSAVVGLLWIVGAVFVLVGRWMPGPIFDLIAFVLRFQLRFFAYHLSFVDRYPSFGESSAPHAPLAET